MNYKIILSTDNKNIGTYINFPEINSIIFLQSGYAFRVDSIKKINDRKYKLYNPNYIIIIQEE